MQNSTMKASTAGIIIIGDEVLSGRTHEKNAHYLAGVLNEIGIHLKQVRIIPDDHNTIRDTARAFSAEYTYVFTSGGIGPTHDDITADAIADAFGVNIAIRDDARAILAAYYPDGQLNDARLRMARIPIGATLIDNPVSQAPGFQIENTFVMAGVPSIFRAMIDSIKPRLVGGVRVLSYSIQCDIPEGTIAHDLGKLANEHPDTSLGSYPFARAGAIGTTLVARNTELDTLNIVAGKLIDILQNLGAKEITKTPPNPS